MRNTSTEITPEKKVMMMSLLCASYQPRRHGRPLGEGSQAITCCLWMFQGSPNCSSACAGLFLKLQLHAGTPCCLWGMNSWQAQQLYVVWIAKHKRDLQWAFSLAEEAGKILSEQWPMTKPAFEKTASPNGPASVSHPPDCVHCLCIFVS